MGEKSAGVNEVNVSEDRIQAEIDAVASEENIADEMVEGSEVSEGAPEINQDLSSYAERLSGLMAGLFNLGFKLFAPGWGVTEKESGNLGITWSAVVVKYLPGSWLRFIPDSGGGGDCVECDAIAATVEVVKPRLEAAMVEAVADQPGRQPEAVTAVETQSDAMPDVHQAGKA